MACFVSVLGENLLQSGCLTARLKGSCFITQDADVSKHMRIRTTTRFDFHPFWESAVVYPKQRTPKTAGNRAYTTATCQTPCHASLSIEISNFSRGRIPWNPASGLHPKSTWKHAFRTQTASSFHITCSRKIFGEGCKSTRLKMNCREFYPHLSSEISSATL